MKTPGSIIFSGSCHLFVSLYSDCVLEEKEKKFVPEVPISEKLKLMLSYSKQSPWYAYTHPNEQEHDFFTTEIDDSMTLKPKFDYYDVDEFRKIKN